MTSFNPSIKYAILKVIVFINLFLSHFHSLHIHSENVYVYVVYYTLYVELDHLGVSENVAE